MCTASLGVNKTAKKEKKVSRSIPYPTEASECELFLVIKFSYLHYFHSLKNCDQNGPLQTENPPFNSSPLNYKAQYESANPYPLMALSLQDIVSIQIAIRRDNTVDLLRLG